MTCGVSGTGNFDGLMVAALAEAAVVLQPKDSLATGKRDTDFLPGELRQPGGRLLHTWTGGVATVTASRMTMFI
jgi:uncharacterized protein YyaL (SSP411 family)